MMAKYATGRNEVFIDVTKTPTHPKICRDINQQNPYESRFKFFFQFRYLSIKTLYFISDVFGAKLPEAWNLETSMLPRKQNIF